MRRQKAEAGPQLFTADEVRRMIDAAGLPLKAMLLLGINAVSQIVKAFGGSDNAAKLTVSARTSEFTTTYYDPYVNILRATTQAFAGVLGGVDALSVATFDSAVRCSDEQSRRIARNIQVMLQSEFNALAPVDPAGGSWYLETLTGQLADAAWKQMQEIEDKGGIIAVLQSGWLQEQIAATLAERFKKLATRAEVAVGTNMYPNMQEEALPGACAADTCDTASACGCGCGSAHDGGIAPIKAHRWTEQYEALRKRTENHKAQTGKNIEVFLANMGPIPQHKARADFSAAFMEVAGFDVLRNDGFASAAAAAKAALATKAQVVVICSTDDTYPEIVPTLAAELKKAAPQTIIVLAGMPAEDFKAAYDTAGVDYYVHMRANCLELLTKIQTAGGMV
jgi:methylmalonyl-CoA mutase